MKKRVEEIMSIDIENLLEKQHSILKEHTIDTLQNIICLLVQEEYDKIRDKLCCLSVEKSCSNAHHINFTYYDKGEEDLYDMLCRLKKLKSKLK